MRANRSNIQSIIEGKTSLGIEFGSTRIKAVLIDEEFCPIASGDHEWENRLEDGVWTYSLDDVLLGLQAAYAQLASDVLGRYEVKLSTVGAIGVSAMMHGYLAFDAAGELLVPFRTWRNTSTEEAAEILSEKFSFNIPQRWSIAHLYQAILDEEEHVADIASLTTLAGYVHRLLTGVNALGVGDAAGMFPIDSKTNTYSETMLDKFFELASERNLPWVLPSILPKVLVAGDDAGMLTEEGAKLLDPTGTLSAGAVFCPAEGDAGTGMVATNSVASRTGNVSAGTSIFAMLVLEEELRGVYREIDVVATPTGKPVAMVHCNNGSSDLDAWVNLFGETLEAFGGRPERGELFGRLFEIALEGDPDCGGLLSYNYFSGEPIAEVLEGRPIFARQPDSRFTLSNFMRATIYSAMATLKLGMDILFSQEHVRVDRLYAHGGLFKTPLVAQRLLAAVLSVSVSVMSSAGEGGAYGIALLAMYRLFGADNLSLEEFLGERVFSENIGTQVEPSREDVEGFEKFIERYRSGLEIERAAIKHLSN
ncbi:MAG: ATPase [Clostridiales Family XIII bacterium]|nr:ATPase [Clostridiales Family XIII bacterium]